ncbi:helix-turn-helix domain-containing protein [Streptomyces sp. SAJ15]|uniref:helix-turn-helix domain-containing protein n=1 Tax=Streptomyces sp. SAJ15 TaxID=2011095 RepID=UPI001184BCFF|nr:helix-turn-helix domain-containing protein [Streptomyces sp. SAJ15]TVL87531.1 transcriptional regulator [Streptomyces sp. SAJ15]
MDNQRGASETAETADLEGYVRAVKTDLATRLRHVRQHHPEGPFTLAQLAERAGVSKRTLASAESADGTNLTIETLVKVAYSLGIQRPAYFLDDQVFRQVNVELETVKEFRRRGVHSVALRTATSSSPAAASVSALSDLLQGILASAKAARDTLHELPAADGGEPNADDGEL